jgi:F420-dependent oxidoreductase-like protein
MLGTIGVVVTTPDAPSTLLEIQRLEDMGIPAAWLTSSGGGGDPLTLFAAAAVQTKRIVLGTSIIQIWPRHPLALANQVHTLASLAPGRLRLGVGPSHSAGMKRGFGVDLEDPLGHLREYVKILKGFLQEGSIDVEGRYYTARAKTFQPVMVPVMISALRLRAFQLAGAEADGAITWVCPQRYLKDDAYPALNLGAAMANRQTPPLIVHTPVAVHDNANEVKEAVRQQLGFYPKLPFYANMFADSGFSGAGNLGWTDELIEAVVAYGSEESVARRLQEIFAWGASEILVTVVTPGSDKVSSEERTLRLLARLS